MPAESRSPVQTRPFLARFAVPRTPSADLPGRYCSDLDQWVIDTSAGPFPAVQNNCSQLATETRVGGEQSDRSADFPLAAATHTAVSAEQDDRSVDNWTAAMATITEVNAEQADYGDQRFTLQMLTVTKVDGEHTDS